MERDVFGTGLWWISATDSGYGVVAARRAVGNAFGWSDESWYTQQSNLQSLYDFLQVEPAMQKEVDDALNDNLREEWLNKVLDLKAPPSTNSQIEETDLDEPEVETTQLEDKPQDPDPTPPPVHISPFAKKQANPPQALPSLDGLQAGMQKMLQGALERGSIDEAVEQIYVNLFHRMGFKYKGTSQGRPEPLLSGSTSIGMCETFRNVFLAAVAKYNELRQQHPVEAIRTGQLTWEADESLVAQKFATTDGLDLIGGLKGNVYLEVDGKGAIIARGYDSINKFVFGHHWSAKVNGKSYDPLFYGATNHVAIRLDGEYKGNGGRYCVAMQKTPGNEFMGSWIWINDWQEFSSTVASMKDLYDTYKKDVDGILSGSLTTRDRKNKDAERPCYAQAKSLVATGVANRTIFLKVVREGTGNDEFTATDATAVEKILELSAKQ